MDEPQQSLLLGGSRGTRKVMGETRGLAGCEFTNRVIACGFLRVRMISSRTISTRAWMSRFSPYVRLLVIRAVIEYLSDAAASPIRDMSRSLTGSHSSWDLVGHAGLVVLRSQSRSTPQILARTSLAGVRFTNALVPLFPCSVGSCHGGAWGSPNMIATPAP